MQELTIEMFQDTAVSSSEEDPDPVDDKVYESQASYQFNVFCLPAIFIRNSLQALS